MSMAMYVRVFLCLLCVVATSSCVKIDQDWHFQHNKHRLRQFKEVAEAIGIDKVGNLRDFSDFITKAKETQLLSEPSENYYLYDSWGTPFRIGRIVRSDGKSAVIIFSAGKNRKYEEGRGDDQGIEIEIPD